jgi:ABC-type dipeptide/oligopeptide/nickel transport system permease subunit
MNRQVRLGLILIGVLVVVALLAPALAPYDPNAQRAALLKNAPPSWPHPFGTDFIGRDVLSRVLYGMRISLAVACLSVLVSVTLGTAVGLVAGFFGGALDIVLMRLVDAGLAIPRLLLVLVVAALWPGLGIPALVLMLGLTSWFGTSRLVRAEVQSIKTREYIAACRASGISRTRTMLRHVLPNVLAPVRVAATLGIGGMVLVEAGLAFLGFGIPEPHATLGKLIRDGELLWAPWTVIAPGVVIILTVASFSVLSDGLRDAGDPRAATR